MIYYIVAENPDNRALKRAREYINEGEIIVFPTETNWVFATSPFSKEGVKRLDQIDIYSSKYLTLICNSISQASKYAFISDNSYRILKRFLVGPYKFIFNLHKDSPKVIRSIRKSEKIGIRIPNTILTERLVDCCECPLMTIAATREILLNHNSDDSSIRYTKEYLEKITSLNSDMVYSYELEEIFANNIKMLLDPGEFDFVGPCSVIDFSEEGMPVIVREGVGKVEF
ncbi:MAG: Sua5/YciO/YrdC/YwlC family protein [Oligoflexia bacterium]|nr:Sua5/YciO/YrdC/YwlC family protein [Oligoflexia bacterium]